jgi:integrase
VKVIFREALYREEINRDPTAGVGRVKYQKEERGIFTTEEFRALFHDHGYDPWLDILDYTCFYLAAVTGLRRREFLALRWRHIDFDRQFLTVSEAWKGRKGIGPPKWDHKRLVPLSSRTIDKLHQIQIESRHLQEDKFIPGLIGIPLVDKIRLAKLLDE